MIQKISNLFTGKIYTPELTNQGLSAKSWYKDKDDNLWLYKIGRKELPASAILDKLNIAQQKL